MPNKNNSPFMVETWKVEGWTDGWDLVRTYDVGGSKYALFLKPYGFGGDDNNCHIHSIRPEGELGPKLFAKRWSQGWTTCEFYTIGAKTFAFFMKRLGAGSDGNNVHINAVNADGDIGANLFPYDWTMGWTLARFYQAGGKPYALFLKALGYADDDNNVHIHKVNVDGSIGTKVHGYRWTPGWSDAEFYYAAGKTFLFLLKRSGAGGDGNNVHMHAVSGSGAIGARIESHEWSSGWSTVRGFSAGGASFLFLLKESNGRVHVRHVSDKGKLGDLVCAYDRDPGYTNAYETGSLAGTEAHGGPRPWSGGWSDASVVELGGRPHILCLKKTLTGDQEKRAKIVAIHPMETVGPVVGFTTDTSANISMTTVASDATLKVTYKRAGDPTKTAAMAVVGDGGTYYRAAAVTLKPLIPASQYSYKVLADDVEVGAGSFRTAPGAGRGVTTVALASCMDLDRDRTQGAWAHLLAKNADLLLMLGDNAYPNTTMRSMIWAEHLQQRGVANYAEVARQTPTCATWDDHDFGPNNSSGADKERNFRDETGAVFREMFPGAPYKHDHAIYYSFRWRDVEFFMLDVRYFRTYYKDDRPWHRRIIGETQRAWLEGALAASTARFKVIATGTTLDSGVTETWAADYPIDWAWLKELSEGEAGIIVVSGDNHHCEHQAHSLGGGKKLHEFISSGIGKDSAEHGFVTLTFDTTTAGTERVTGRLFRQNGTQRGTDIVVTLASLA